jgi:copper(I)-binding protein
LALSVPFGLTACGGDDGAATTTTAKPATTATTSKTATPKVSDAWARTAAAGGNGAVYLTLSGDGTANALISASVPSDLAEKVELHETVSGATTGDATTSSMAGAAETTTTAQMGAGDSGSTAPGGSMMKMQKVDRIEVPASGAVKLEPGGYHVMMFGLKQRLAVGDTVPVTLTFAEGGEVTVDAPVREM